MTQKFLDSHSSLATSAVARGVALLLVAVGGASCGVRARPPKAPHPAEKLMSELAEAQSMSNELLGDLERAARHVARADDEWSAAHRKRLQAENMLRRKYEAVRLLRAAKARNTHADLGGRIAARDVPAALDRALRELQQANADYDAASAAEREADKRRAIALRTYRTLKEQRSRLRLQVAELENELRTLALRTVERDAKRKIAHAEEAARRARENLTIASAALDYDMGRNERPHIPAPGQKEREEEALIHHVAEKIGSTER